MKIVINREFGGFSLTDEMIEYVGYKKGNKWDRDYEHDRTDPKLIEYIENTPVEKHGSLKIVEIPDDVDWIIENYDGEEWISEKHRTWR